MLAAMCVAACSLLPGGCGDQGQGRTPPATAPPAAVVETDMDAEQFQGGPSRPVPAGDRRGASRGAGAERHRRGESGCFAQCAGAVARHRPRGGDRRPAGRRSEKRPASVQSPQHRYRGRVFRLSQGRRERAADQNPARSRQASVRARRDSPRARWKSRRTPRTTPMSTSKPPPSICSCSDPTPTIPPASWKSSRPFRA